MKEHICREATGCCCYTGGLEPDEGCPIHGHPWPPRCCECGRFLPRKSWFKAEKPPYVLCSGYMCPAPTDSEQPVPEGFKSWDEWWVAWNKGLVSTIK